MQLVVEPYELPSAPSFNYDELKTGLTEKVHVYETMVYGDDQIKQAKSDRADLNRLKKALNDERIRREKEYMEPFKQFQYQIDEITSIIEKPIAVIDSQIKAYEKKKKDEKREQIKAIFTEAGLPEYITLEKVWDESWLNSSVSPSRIKDCLKDVAFRDEKAMQMIQELPDYSFEAAEYYKQSLDVTAAMAKASEHARLEKAKKAAEQQAEVEDVPFTDPVPEVIDAEPAEVKREWIKFSAYLSMDEARELAQFFNYNKIQFKPISE